MMTNDDNFGKEAEHGLNMYRSVEHDVIPLVITQVALW